MFIKHLMKKSNPPHATMKTVAEHLGLSVAAVSMALNDTGTISHDTRARVKAAAKELGYRPSPLLAALANRRYRPQSAASRGAIAFIRCCTDEYAGPESFAETASRAAELGYSWSAWSVSPRASWAKLGQTLHHRGVLGVIITPIFGMTSLPDFPWSRFAIVSSGRNFFRVPFPEVAADPFDRVLDVHARILALGYRRPGYVLLRHARMHPDDQARAAAVGFVLAQVPQRDRVPAFESLFDKPLDGLPGWFHAHQPDVVIGFHPGIKIILEAAGVAFPGQCGFASLHLQDYLDSHSGCAGFRDSIPAEQLAAVDLLDQQIRHHRFGPIESPFLLRMPFVWVDGPTLPPRGRSPSRRR